MNELLELSNLKGGYVKGPDDILNGINLTVSKSEAVGIIGLNGSGKSTLGKAIMNLLPYRSGKILFNGHSIESKPTHELARMGISMMHQGGMVFPNLSVWQNLTLAGWEDNADDEYNNQLRSSIPLLQESRKKMSRTMADTLSGGERHKLALAMTLVRKPKLLILDEPSAGLSPTSVEEMYGILGKIRCNPEFSILLIEQNISRAVAFCNRCVLMEAGSITYCSSENGADLSEIEKIMFKR